MMTAPRSTRVEKCWRCGHRYDGTYEAHWGSRLESRQQFDDDIRRHLPNAPTDRYCAGCPACIALVAAAVATDERRSLPGSRCRRCGASSEYSGPLCRIDREDGSSFELEHDFVETGGQS
jgi:hypothetical protein